jgi:hypothetical protein
MPKRVGRPTTKPKAGQKSGIMVRVSPVLKRRILDAMKRADRSLSSEAEIRLEASFAREDRLGGAQAEAFWEGTAQTAVAKYGRNWLNDPYACVGVGELCQQMLLAARPSVSDAEWMLTTARRALDALEHGHDPIYVQVARAALDFSYQLAEPPPAVVAVRTEYDDLLLRYEAAVKTLEDATVEPLPDSIGQDHPDFVGSQHFPTAWATARAVLLSQSQTAGEPSDRQIAEYLAGSADLKYLCGLHATPQSSETVLRYRAELLAKDQAAPQSKDDLIEQGRRLPQPPAKRSRRRRSPSNSSIEPNAPQSR